MPDRGFQGEVQRHDLVVQRAGGRRFDRPFLSLRRLGYLRPLFLLRRRSGRHLVGQCLAPSMPASLVRPDLDAVNPIILHHTGRDF